MNKDDVLLAYSRIKPHIRRTPLLNSPRLNTLYDCKIYFKAENLQITGAFKLRGALNALLSQQDFQKKSLLAYSSGNHAQAVAYIGQIYQRPTTIIMPSDAPRLKIENTRAYGANVHLYDRNTQSREDIAAEYINENTLLIPPFEDDNVIAGQGTISLEILEEHLPDCLFSPLGGGGLMSGQALAMPQNVQLIGAEPEGFDDWHRSLLSGKREKNAALSGSICDSILTPSPGKRAFEILKNRLNRAISVSDQDILRAMSILAQELKILVEAGGAAGFAAFLQNPKAYKGKKVAIILSGGNADLSLFSRSFSD